MVSPMLTTLSGSMQRAMHKERFVTVNRHRRPPLGVTSRYDPRSSRSRIGLSAGLVAWIWVSPSTGRLRRLGGNCHFGFGSYPKTCPH